MILVASPAKPFEYTAKFTTRRQAIITAYEPEIESLYTTVGRTTQADLTPPPVWDTESATNFVRTVVNKVLKKAATDTDDIFQQGCDRCGTWIDDKHTASSDNS